MTTVDLLKESKKELDNNIKKLLEDFIAKNGNVTLKVEAHTYYSEVDHFAKMYAYSNTKLEIH